MDNRPIVFMDRDGVINIDIGTYITEWSQFQFLPGSLDLIKIFTQAGFRIVIITNQSQISRGLMSEYTLNKIHMNMLKEIHKFGGAITKIYYCPHQIDDNCKCKKPLPGMLLKAQKELGINFENSVFIGNSWKDMDAGSAVGCTTCFLIDHLTDLHMCGVEPDFCIADIIQAKSLIPAFFNNLK